MSLLVCGLNHKTAALPIREKVLFNQKEVGDALQHLIRQPAVNEAMILSTCNRTELYATVDDVTTVTRWMRQRAHWSELDASKYGYRFEGEDMVRHVMRVASGLDSMIVGEPQIFGQIKRAYAFAKEQGSIGAHFQQLFPAVFAASKLIRSETSVGAHSVSIAYTAVQLAKRIFHDITSCRALLIGAGETIDLVATHLYGQGLRRMVIANRTLERAKSVAEPFAAEGIRIAEIPQYLAKVDLIITATASQLPILGKGAIESAMQLRKHKPIFIADLAVPRDVEQEVRQLPDIYIYNLDDIQRLIVQNQQNRNQAAAQAEEMIALQASRYMRQLGVLKAGDMISRYRQQSQHTQQQELQKALNYLERVGNPREALSYLAHNLTNKLIHAPTVKMRQAAYEERLEILLFMKELFEL